MFFFVTVLSITQDAFERDLAENVVDFVAFFCLENVVVFVEIDIVEWDVVCFHVYVGYVLCRLSLSSINNPIG